MNCCADTAGNCATFFEDTAQPACLPSIASFATSAEVAELLSNFEKFECYHNVTNKPAIGTDGLTTKSCEQLRETYYAGLGCAECADAPNAVAQMRLCNGHSTQDECERYERNCSETEAAISRGAWGADLRAAGCSAIVGLLSYVFST